jgi:hypothetical protein
MWENMEKDEDYKFDIDPHEMILFYILYGIECHFLMLLLHLATILLTYHNVHRHRVFRNGHRHNDHDCFREQFLLLAQLQPCL